MKGKLFTLPVRADLPRPLPQVFYIVCDIVVDNQHNINKYDHTHYMYASKILCNKWLSFGLYLIKHFQMSL